MRIMPSVTGNLPAFPGLDIERLHGGKPIIAPTELWWENGVTFNSAAVYLPRSTTNDPLIRRLLEVETLHDPLLSDGVVAAHYRARPRPGGAQKLTPSFAGLAVFTPDTTHLLKRYREPVLAPSSDPASADALGAEDVRITRFDDTFYKVYCGVSAIPRGRWKASLCLARSHDLLQWDKLGPANGALNRLNNKDGVLFPDKLDGRYLLLHRPMAGPMRDWGMHLALSEELTGTWEDCGAVLYAAPQACCRASWVGAGSVPIPLGDRRYLVIFHTGHRLRNGCRQYDLDAAIFNLNQFDANDPAKIVEARIDRLMVPETHCEINGPCPDSVANVLFTCGTYVYRDDLYILYGGGDTFVMSARIKLASLLNALEKERVGAPRFQKSLSLT